MHMSAWVVSWIKTFASTHNLPDLNQLCSICCKDKSVKDTCAREYFGEKNSRYLDSGRS